MRKETRMQLPSSVPPFFLKKKKLKVGRSLHDVMIVSSCECITEKGKNKKKVRRSARMKKKSSKGQRRRRLHEMGGGTYIARVLAIMRRKTKKKALLCVASSGVKLSRGSSGSRDQIYRPARYYTYIYTRWITGIGARARRELALDLLS